MADAATQYGRYAELDEVKRLVLDKRCVALVGAGVSIPPSHTWWEVVRSLASQCGVKTDGRSPLDIVDECLDKDEALCDAYMREELPRHHATTRTLLGHVPRLPFQAILTTNFDPWLHQQSRTEDFSKCLIYPDLPLTDGIDKRLIYLHGLFDSEGRNATVRNLVFGRRSFERAYGPASLLPGFLLNVFTFRSVIFVGFNPTEDYIAEILKRSIETRRAVGDPNSSAAPRRFALLERCNGRDPVESAKHEDAVAKLHALEITPCLYEPRAADRRGLDALIYSWVMQGDLKNRPAPFVDSFSMGTP